MPTSAELATLNHGSRTWDYKQTKLRTLSAQIFNKRVRHTYKGICAGLCVRWVKEHSSGSSLEAVLGGGSGTAINSDVLNEVVRWQGGGGYSTRYASALTSHGLTRIWTNNFSSGGGGNVIPSLWQDLTTKFNSYHSCYCLIDIDGKVMDFSVGHLMCMHVDANQNVLFFDPNHGEFSFNNMYDFNQFFIAFMTRNYTNFRRNAAVMRFNG